MVDTLLIKTLFLLTSLLVCLFTLRLSINIKVFCVFFHSLQMLTNFLPSSLPPQFILTLPFIKVNENLQAPYSPFIRHLRLAGLTRNFPVSNESFIIGSFHTHFDRHLLFTQNLSE